MIGERSKQGGLGQRGREGGGAVLRVIKYQRRKKKKKASIAAATFRRGSQKERVNPEKNRALIGKVGGGLLGGDYIQT